MLSEGGREGWRLFGQRAALSFFCDVAPGDLLLLAFGCPEWRLRLPSALTRSFFVSSSLCISCNWKVLFCLCMMLCLFSPHGAAHGALGSNSAWQRSIETLPIRCRVQREQLLPLPPTRVPSSTGHPTPRYLRFPFRRFSLRRTPAGRWRRQGGG